MSRRNTWDTGKYTKLEPVSNTSRRGVRAAYHDEYPRDFGPRVAYTVSQVSHTSRPPTLCRPPIRQGGREMSAPRPYETYPFHPPALFTSFAINQFQYIYKTVADISCMWCLHYGFLVSKETVVLRRWERSKQKSGFIKRVDKG